MKKKMRLTTEECKMIITLAKAYLADKSRTQKEKEEMFWTAQNFLIEHGGYNGFNWIQWCKNGGAEQFFKDYPDHENRVDRWELQSQDKYMGKEYDRFFY